MSPTAEAFLAWTKAPPSQREALVRESPHLGQASWEMFRAPAPYDQYHYHAKTANRFLTQDGGECSARFRLIPAARTPDVGLVSPAGRLLPPDVMPRRPDDARPTTFLHDEFRSRVAGDGVNYILQAQIRPAGDDSALDCTRPWPETDFPWRDVASLHLVELVNNERVERLCFNPFHAPPELALPLARSASEMASLAHARSVVYEVVGRRRAGLPLSDALQGLLEQSQAPPVRKPASAEPGPGPAPAAASRRPAGLRVCVVGAGPSGLTAAWELERLGHQVTVLERGPRPGGKCATVEIDGRAYDLAGHICTATYTSVARLAQEVGVPTEPATPARVFDLATRRVLPGPEPAELRDDVLRYHALRVQHFPRIGAPGCHDSRALASPVRTWLAEHGLERLGAFLGINSVSCGYGYLQDPQLPALYLVKYGEMAGMLSPPKSSLPQTWTIKGGFARLWEAVASRLRDVRCNAAPRFIERRDGRVRIATAAGIQEFDRLVIAAPLQHLPGYLDVTLEERDLFAQIRTLDYYTTVCLATGVPEEGFYLLKQHCEDAGQVGHAVAIHHRHPGSNVCLVYSYGSPQMDGSEVERLLRQDLAGLGGNVEKVLSQHRWEHFPHASSAALGEGFYDRLEALQGQRDTYYLGSICNFDLVECNVAYARQLAERSFTSPQKGPAELPTHDSLPASLDGLRQKGESLVAQMQEFLQILRGETPLPAAGVGTSHAGQGRQLTARGEVRGTAPEALNRRQALCGGSWMGADQRVSGQGCSSITCNSCWRNRRMG